MNESLPAVASEQDLIRKWGRDPQDVHRWSAEDPQIVKAWSLHMAGSLEKHAHPSGNSIPSPLQLLGTILGVAGSKPENQLASFSMGTPESGLVRVRIRKIPSEKETPAPPNVRVTGDRPAFRACDLAPSVFVDLASQIEKSLFAQGRAVPEDVIYSVAVLSLYRDYLIGRNAATGVFRVRKPTTDGFPYMLDGKPCDLLVEFRVDRPVMTPVQAGVPRSP